MEDSIEVRHVRVEEIEAFERSKTITFLDDLDEVPRFAQWRQAFWDSDRTWGAIAEGRFVGTLRTFNTALSVPGAGGDCPDVSADALTNVTVAATHRRRGLLSRMLAASLDAGKERGELVSILVAAEWPIYGRFGYWPAATWTRFVADRRRVGARLQVPVTGSLRQIEMEELRKIAPTVFAAARRQRAGHIERADYRWDRDLLPEMRPRGARERIAIVHETEHGVDGYLLWYPTADFDLRHGGEITVEQLFAADQAGYTALWGYLFGMDVIDRFTIGLRPADEPLPFLLADGRSVRAAEQVDGLWLRLLDVAGALAGRRYSAPGRICFEVVDDDYGGYAAGRYVLDGGPDGAQCVATSTESPQLRLSQRSLAAVYLGLPSLRHQHSAGYVDELEPGALQQADAMFVASVQPWASTSF